MSQSTVVRYQQPGWLVRRVMNPLVLGMTRAGVSVWGSRILEVRGRQSGAPRRTPVNVLEFEGRQYLVSPRGEGQWVRNVRADDGRLTLLLGRTRDERIAAELADADKSLILRSYLRRWKMEVGVFFDGVDADSSEDELQRIAPRHPVFVLAPGPVAQASTEQGRDDDVAGSEPSPSGLRAILKAANLGVRFLVELAAYASLGYWGASLGGPAPVHVCAAVLAPLLAIVVWSRFLAPKARRHLREPAAVVLEVVIFLGAAAGLASAGPVALAGVFGAVAVANSLLVRYLER